MECNICLTKMSEYQWGIVDISILDSGWVDMGSEVSFGVHRYCMNEAVEWYTQEVADGFLEHEYLEEAKGD